MRLNRLLHRVHCSRRLSQVRGHTCCYNQCIARPYLVVCRAVDFQSIFCGSGSRRFSQCGSGISCFKLRIRIQLSKCCKNYLMKHVQFYFKNLNKITSIRYRYRTVPISLHLFCFFCFFNSLLDSDPENECPDFLIPVILVTLAAGTQSSLIDRTGTVPMYLSVSILNKSKIGYVCVRVCAY